MARRPRPLGGPLPKSRATRRGPRDQEIRDEASALDFAETIEAWLARDDRLERLEALDLRAFVHECAHPNYGPGDRLRRLAIYLDQRASTWRWRPLQEWEIFARVYDEAERYDPDNAWLFHARAATAVELGWWRNDEADAKARARLMAIAKVAVTRGLELDPADAELHHLAGYVLYMDRPNDLEAALDHCERALELKPNHSGASLYKAHCLHDLGRWSEAAAAYAAVEAARFKRGQAWRGELAREQGAYSLWRCGELEQARGRFESILERREAAAARGEPKDSVPVLHDPPIYMAEALASGDFGPVLPERLRAHLEAIGELWVLERASGC